MADAPGVGVHLVRGAGVARERHVHVARAVVGTVARHDEPAPLARSLARDAHGIFVGVGAAEREEHESALESRQLEQPLGQFLSRPGAPGARHETEPVGLRLDRGDQPRVLVTEIAALDEARHVEHFAAALEQEPGAAAADHARGIPVGRHAPAMQHEFPFGGHPRNCLTVALPGNVIG